MPKKKAILEDVYRENTQGVEAVYRHRRHRKAMARKWRKRSHMVGVIGLALALVYLGVLAAHWTPQARHKRAALVSMNHLTSASFLQHHTHTRQSRLPYTWFERNSKHNELNANLQLNSASLPDSALKALIGSKPMVPQRSWFKGYAGLISHSGMSLASLFGLGVKTIVIDPGHGGRDPGAIGPNGLYEKTVTLAVAKDLKQLLEQLKGYRVFLTRTTDTYVALKKRAEFANSHHADLFISIHVNSIPEKNQAVAETFYFGPAKSHAILQLAKAENGGSNYSEGDLHRLVKKISNTFKTRQSRTLARLIQKSLYRNIKRNNDPMMGNAGIHTAPFVVLLDTDMPSVLAEISCISNPAEARRLTKTSYREAIAKYLEKGILAYLRRRNHELEPTNGASKYAGEKNSVHTG